MLPLEVKLPYDISSYAYLMQNLGMRLKRIRNDHGRTQEEIAKVMGISASALSQVESGQTKNLRLEHFFKFCAYFDLDPYIVATGKHKAALRASLRASGGTLQGSDQSETQK